MEYLGGVPTLPGLSRDSPGGRIQMSLAAMARYNLVMVRGRSVYKEMYKFAHRTNMARFLHEFYFPVHFDATHERNGLTQATKWELFRLWRELRQRNLSRAAMERERWRFLELLPNKLTISHAEGQIARFMMYGTIDYFDSYLTSPPPIPQ